MTECPAVCYMCVKEHGQIYRKTDANKKALIKQTKTNEKRQTEGLLDR